MAKYVSLEYFEKGLKAGFQSVRDWFDTKSAGILSTATEKADEASVSASLAAAAVAHYPYIGTNGHWYVWDAVNEVFVDTQVTAQGPAGADGEDGEDGEDGAPGADGEDGEDGFSPVVTVTNIPGGHRVTITDALGDHTFDVMDGQGGGGTGDHTQLTNRDAAQQHPISAITDLQTTLDGKGTYSKPGSGIPKTDLASGVQTSLDLADSAIQSHQSLDGCVKLAGSGVQEIASNARNTLKLKASYAGDHENYLGFSTFADGNLGYIGYDGQDVPVAIDHDGTTKHTLAYAAELTSHTGDTSNPHSVTAAQAGAKATSNVEDIEHGGTGATTAADARTALGVPTLGADGKVIESQTKSTVYGLDSDKTLTAADSGTMIWCSNSTDITITIPTGFEVHTEVEIVRGVAGNVIITPASEVAIAGIEIYGTCKITDQYGACALKHIGGNFWLITGSVEAV